MAAWLVVEASPFDGIFICVFLVVGGGCVFDVGIEVREE